MSVLNWLKSLFGSATNQETKQQDQVEAEILKHAAKAEKITYRENLVNNLKLDHQNLLALYGGMLESIHESEYTKIVGQLETFKTNFNAHLHTENLKLYVFLEQNVKEDADEFKKIRKYRREMRDIENAVNKFLTNWITSGINAENASEFETQLKAIGEALVKRIESEEHSLYPMYDQAA